MVGVDVGGVHQHDGSPVVASLLQQLLRLVEVLLRQRVRVGVGAVRAVAHEEGRARLPETLGTVSGTQVSLLIHHPQQRLARLLVVERRVQMIGAQPRLGAEQVSDFDLDARGPFQHRYEVRRRKLPVIHLPLLQGGVGGGGVGQIDPLDALHVHALAAGRKTGRLVARHVGVVAAVYHLVSRTPLVRHEDERAGAGGVLNLLVRRRRGDARRHDERHVAAGLGEGVQDEAEGLFEGQPEGFGVECFEAFGEGHEQLPLAVLAAPAPQRRDHVFRHDRLAVVPQEAIAQREGVLQGVVAHLPGVHHLRPDFQVFVQGEQHVVDHVTVVAGDVGGGPDGVDDLQIGVRDEFEGAAVPGFLRHRVRREAETEAPCETGHGENKTQLARESWCHSLPFVRFSAGAIASVLSDCYKGRRADERTCRNGTL